MTDRAWLILLNFFKKDLNMLPSSCVLPATACSAGSFLCAVGISDFSLFGVERREVQGAFVRTCLFLAPDGCSSSHRPLSCNFWSSMSPYIPDTSVMRWSCRRQAADRGSFLNIKQLPLSHYASGCVGHCLFCLPHVLSFACSPMLEVRKGAARLACIQLLRMQHVTPLRPYSRSLLNPIAFSPPGPKTWSTPHHVPSCYAVPVSLPASPVSWTLGLVPVFHCPVGPDLNHPVGATARSPKA